MGNPCNFFKMHMGECSSEDERARRCWYIAEEEASRVLSHASALSVGPVRSAGCQDKSSCVELSQLPSIYCKPFIDCTSGKKTGTYQISARGIPTGKACTRSGVCARVSNKSLTVRRAVLGRVILLVGSLHWSLACSICPCCHDRGQQVKEGGG